MIENRKSQRRYKVFQIVILLIIILLLSACVRREDEKENSQKGFEYTVLDTGKSDCMIILMDDIVIVNDVGDYDDYDDYSHLKKTLDGKGIKKIDYVVISHFDKDHMGGARQLIIDYDVEKVYVPDYVIDANRYEELKRAVNDRGTKWNILNKNETIKFQKGQMRLFAAHKTFYEDENDYSIVSLFEYEGSSILAMGDAKKERIEEFAEDYENECKDICIDMIKIPHHGDYNKPLEHILEITNAKYGIITCDKTKETVSKKLIRGANEIGCELIFSSDGDFVARFDNGEIQIKQ